MLSAMALAFLNAGMINSGMFTIRDPDFVFSPSLIIKGLLKDGKIHIGDNDLLKIHLLDSAIKMSTERGRGKLVKIRPSAHIDGCAALLDAMTVRQKWWGEIGSRLQNDNKD